MQVSGIASRRQVGGFSIRWDQARADAAYASGDWVATTLADALAHAAAVDPRRLVLVDGEVRMDAASLYRQARALAANLMARMPAGSVVSFMLPNWHEAAVVYHAITLAGMVAHPVLPSLREHELKFQLDDVGSRMLFCPREFRRHDYVAMFERIRDSLATSASLVVVRGDPGPHLRYADLLEGPAAMDTPPLDADAVRMVMYTSGTTGRSKGVLHTHNSLHALLRQIGRHWRVAPGDAFLVPSPISHIGGSIYAFEAPVLLGSRAVLMERWEPEVALSLAAGEGCTHICGATPFLEQLLEAARARQERLPQLKLFVCGGASVPPQLIRAAAAHFDRAAVTRVYGSTEVPVTTVGCPSREALDDAADTDGRPGSAEVRLAGSGETVAGDGEVLVRGPQMLLGYLHAEDESTAFDADGFYRSGDLGRFVDNGCLVISGRSKDIIIRNGENIAPKEVEDLLLGHPGIAEIAIVGVPDPRTGERACAVVVPRPGATPDVAAIAGFLAARGVAKFKFPEAVALWEELPRNDTGKVLKHRIRAQLSASVPHTQQETKA